MSKTTEERALESLRKVRKEEYEFNHSAHGALMPPDTTYVGGYIQGANEQRKIDKEAFDTFLCGLRNSNMWEGREWRFQRLWREFQESMEG